MSIITYSLTNDFTKSHKLNMTQFLADLQTVTLSVRPVQLWAEGDTFYMRSETTFSPSDLATLTTLVANHDTSTSIYSALLNTPTGTEQYIPVSNGQYIYASFPAAKTTTSTTFSNAVTMTTPNLPAGDYEIQFYFNWNYSVVNSTFQAQGLIDNTTQFFTLYEKIPVSFAAGKSICSGFYVASLSNGIHQLSVQFASGTSGQTATISNCRIRLMKTN